MPQPDSSRIRAHEGRLHPSTGTWPVDPAAPRRATPQHAGRAAQPRPRKEDPAKDGRTPHDPDGNEELEREEREHPSTRHPAEQRHAAGRARYEAETEDTGEWVATERFTLDSELDDTWPNVPAR